MAFHPLAAQSVFFCKNRILDQQPRALDLGTQTLQIDLSFLDWLIRKFKVESEVILKNFDKIKSDKKFTTPKFFEALGFQNYSSIDINGAYGCLEFDLNTNIKELYDFHDEYDLVINNGTGEHVFNQANLYLNFHNLTKKNGIMLNIVPFTDWINHGFYNYNPIFFADLAASNGYEIIKITLGNRMGKELDISPKDQKYLYEQIKPHQENTTFKKIMNLCEEKFGKNMYLIVVTRKLTDQEFKVPLQGKYLADIHNKETSYQTQRQGSEIAEGQLADYEKRVKSETS